MNTKQWDLDIEKGIEAEKEYKGSNVPSFYISIVRGKIKNEV